jgi:ATP-dependent RNA helicase HrpB
MNCLKGTCQAVPPIHRGRIVLSSLPVDAYLPEIVAALDRHRAVVVIADPGAGKTTRVPPALTSQGAVLLLQPRRAAARAIANRIAQERGWTIGLEIGWQVRLEHRFSADTRLLVATEGILTARLQQDPLLSTFRTIVLDEFHERSVHADLGIALARQAWRARDDLRLVVMSATLDADRVSSFLDGCPVVRVAGRLFPLDISYAPSASVADAAVELFSAVSGDVLCFLPGAFEIQKTVGEVRTRLPSGVEILPLHGTLEASDQDRALSASKPGVRRIVVATNIAETSVTVPGVNAVVDAGLQKVARYDAARAIDSLATERITQDAADQRAGRAGRTGPGLVRRLWDVRDRLRPHREPDVHRIDLSSAALDIFAWGGNPSSFEWFESPRDEAIQAAIALLERLEAVRGGRLTPIGRTMQSIALHPRLARILLAGSGSRIVAQACAIVSERLFLPPRSAATTSDLLSAIDGWNNLPIHIHRVAREIEDTARRLIAQSRSASLSEHDFRRAILAGYPDRVGWRREPFSLRVKLSSGAGAQIAQESGVRGGEFLVAIDLQASIRPNDPESRIRIASLVDREWLARTSSERVHRLDGSGTVRAVEIEKYDELVLSEKPVAIDEAIAARLLADGWRERGGSAEDNRLIRRLKFASVPFDLDGLVVAAARGMRSLSEVRLDRALRSDVVKALDHNAPETLPLPSGRAAQLDYKEDGTVGASAKLQELFGLGETPRVGPRGEPVVLSLLAPNGRPVQVTRDLKSFWDRTYPEVRKELRGRYPKHPWPEDPWNAPPTARAKPRRK